MVWSRLTFLLDSNENELLREEMVDSGSEVIMNLKKGPTCQYVLLFQNLRQKFPRCFRVRFVVHARSVVCVG